MVFEKTLYSTDSPYDKDCKKDRQNVRRNKANQCRSGIAEHEAHGCASQLHQQLHRDCECYGKKAVFADPLFAEHSEHKKCCQGCQVTQPEEDTIGAHILEGDARKKFRKWDNVKYIIETPKERKYPKTSYKNKNWGMEIKTNNRLDPKDGVGVRFGVVVTLKEMFNKNRIDEFIRSCNLDGWLVNVIDIDNRIDIHEKINEEIEFS